VPRLAARLRATGAAIPERRVVRPPNAGRDASLDEAREGPRAGLAAAGRVSVDGTGARREHRDGVRARLGDGRSAAFVTTAPKGRPNPPEVPRAGHRDRVADAEAPARMRRRARRPPARRSTPSGTSRAGPPGGAARSGPASPA
jgi:hypothetical protein